MNVRQMLKRIVQGVALAIALPGALLSGWGRIPVMFTFFAQLHALVPGMPGDLLRSAFYKYTLRECSIDTVISFGTYFSRREARVAPNVSIGSYCVIGRASIGARTQISSHVEIPSGRYQHTRDERGRFQDSTDGEIAIGEDCWIGAAAVILAAVGDGSTIGAGSVVVKDVAAHTVAVGNPAKPLLPKTGGGAAS